MAKTKTISIPGWVLISKDDDGSWYICWNDIFPTRNLALGFALKHKWPKPYSAVRGSLSAHPTAR